MARTHQGRFASYALGEPYLLTAARYDELNPVRAGLIESPSRYRWSSAAARVRGRDDALVRVRPKMGEIAFAVGNRHFGPVAVYQRKLQRKYEYAAAYPWLPVPPDPPPP